jgi:hypothetical protein
MKPAVFEIGDRDGHTRLVYVDVPSLGDAVELEAALRRDMPHNHVRLLGRFDSVEFASSLDEFMEAAASPEFIGQGGFEGRMRRLMRG